MSIQNHQRLMQNHHFSIQHHHFSIQNHHFSIQNHRFSDHTPATSSACSRFCSGTCSARTGSTSSKVARTCRTHHTQALRTPPLEGGRCRFHSYDECCCKSEQLCSSNGDLSPHRLEPDGCITCSGATLLYNCTTT